MVSDLLRVPVFALATAFFGSLSLATSLFDKSGLWQHRIASLWARTSIWISGSRVTILNGERLRELPAAVLVSNHLSYMDTPAIFSTLPFQFRIVARQSLWNIPFIGWHLHRSGQIPVNVSNPRASVASLSRGVKTLQSGMSLFIFPEGGRSKDGLLAPLMNGPAYMAIRAKVSVVPIALVGTYELLPMHTTRFHPCPVLLVVGTPIFTEGYTLRDTEALTDQIAASLQDLYYAHTYLRRPAESPPSLLDDSLRLHDPEPTAHCDPHPHR